MFFGCDYFDGLIDRVAEFMHVHVYDGKIQKK